MSGGVVVVVPLGDVVVVFGVVVPVLGTGVDPGTGVVVAPGVD